jgi:flagellar assembly protein FliH
MMLSSSRILKRHAVSVDTENKVVIDIGETLDIDSPDPDIVSDDPNKRERDARKSAEKEAARMVRHAESQAEDIISNAIKTAAEKQAAIQKKAEDEAANIMAESREMGYQSGMDSARQEGDAIKAQAQQVLDDANAERAAMQESLEPEIVNMIISITEKLLGNIAEVNPKVITNLVKQGFADATITGNVVVYVSADDYDQVIENKDELLAVTDGSVKLEIKKDLSLSPMDCVIETPFGDIDCSLGQQFESLRANLTYILNNR